LEYRPASPTCVENEAYFAARLKGDAHEPV